MFRGLRKERESQSSQNSASSSPPKGSNNTNDKNTTNSVGCAALVLDAPTRKPSKALKNSGFPRTHFKCPDGRYALGKQYLVVPEMTSNSARKEQQTQLRTKGLEDFTTRMHNSKNGDPNASILCTHFYDAQHRMTMKLLFVAKGESVAMFDYNAPSKDGCVKILKIDRAPNEQRSSRSSSSYFYSPTGGGGGSQHSNSTKGVNGVDEDGRETVTCMTWTGERVNDWKFADVQQGGNNKPTNNTNDNNNNNNNNKNNNNSSKTASTIVIAKDEYVPDMFIGLSSGAMLAVKLRKSFSDKRANTTKRLLHKMRYQTQTKDKISSSGSVHRTTCMKVSPDGKIVVSLHASGDMYLYDRSLMGFESSQPSTTANSGHSIAEVTQFAPILYPEDSRLDVATSSTTTNPRSRWHFGAAPLESCAFSESGKKLCVCSRDGVVRVIDIARAWRETNNNSSNSSNSSNTDSNKNIFTVARFIDTGFRSYFGAIFAAAFSPCGRFIAAGGEAAIVEMFDCKHKCVVTYGGAGHQSWVSDICFDVHMATNDKNSMNAASSSSSLAMQHNADNNHAEDDDSDSDTNLGNDVEPGTLRVVSVGADCQMCVWDFLTEAFIDEDDEGYNEEEEDEEEEKEDSGSDGDTMMHDDGDYSERHPHHRRQRSRSVAIGGGNISRELNFVDEDDDSFPTTTKKKKKKRDDLSVEADVIVESMKRNETTRLLPVMAHKFHDRPIATVQTNEHGILTSCDSGKVKLWSRPITKERYLTFVQEVDEEGEG